MLFLWTMEGVPIRLRYGSGRSLTGAPVGLVLRLRVVLSALRPPYRQLTQNKKPDQIGQAFL